MNTDYYYNASGEININKKSTGKVEKSVKRLLIVAAVILAAQLVWLFGISPFIPYSTVEVHGFSPLNRAEILSIAGIDENSSFFSTNAREIQNVLSSHILVESALVMKRFPDRLSIFLNPRTASALVLSNINSKQVPVLLDRHGVFYKIGDTSSGETVNLPVISGIENPQIGMRFPSALVPLVENLSYMAIAAPELLSAISEIRIEQKTWDGYELVLYPVHSSIRVRTENNLTEDTIRYIMLMLNIFEDDIQKPHEIDFRSGMGTYKIKEQS